MNTNYIPCCNMKSRIVEIGDSIRKKGFTPQWCLFMVAITLVANVATTQIFKKIVYKMPKVDLIDLINNPPKFIGDSRIIFESLKDIYIRREDSYLKLANECTLFVEPFITMTVSSISMRLKDGLYCNLNGKGILRWPDILVTQELKREALKVNSHEYLSFLQSLFYVLWHPSKVSKTPLLISSLKVLFAAKIGIITTSTIFAIVYSYRGFGKLGQSQEFKWWILLNSSVLSWIICNQLAVVSLCILDHKIPGWKLHLTILYLCLQILLLGLILLISCSQYSNILTSKISFDDEKEEFDEENEIELIEGNCKKSIEGNSTILASSPGSLSTGSGKAESLDPLKLVFQDISIRETGHIIEYHSNSPKINNRSVSAPIFLTTNSSPLSANPNEVIKSSLSIKRSMKASPKQRILQENTPLINSFKFDESASPQQKESLNRQEFLDEVKGNIKTEEPTKLESIQQDTHSVADL